MSWTKATTGGGAAIFIPSSDTNTSMAAYCANQEGNRVATRSSGPEALGKKSFKVYPYRAR